MGELLFQSCFNLIASLSFLVHIAYGGFERLAELFHARLCLLPGDFTVFLATYLLVDEVTRANYLRNVIIIPA